MPNLPKNIKNLLTKNTRQNITTKTKNKQNIPFKNLNHLEKVIAKNRNNCY